MAKRNPRPVGWAALRGSFTERALAAAATTAPAVAYGFGLFTPSWYDVRRASCDAQLADGEMAELLDAMRAGYVPASGLALAVGVAASLLGKSWLPLLVAAGTATTLIAVHEAAAPPDLRLTPAQALGVGALALNKRTAPAPDALPGRGLARRLPAAAPAKTADL